MSDLPEEIRRQALPALARVKEKMDWESYGGAPLLGVRGAALIAHGSSTRRAVSNALVMAHQSADKDLPGRVAAALGSSSGPPSGV
jgi:glycerol-3-phosphate acyltransferase PlsX